MGEQSKASSEIEAKAETGKIPEGGQAEAHLREVQLPCPDKWLEAFYRECGREVTLAYTTLNQMKNWAMLVTAAAISGLAFGTSAAQYPNRTMLIGVVVVYTFTLRFFIRANLCYINLSRWNTLQSDCVQLMLSPKLATSGQAKTKADLVEQLRQDIQHYYHQWLSPISRKAQVFANLKLGFALLFALPLFFLIWGIAALWDNSLVKALAFFALGNTVVELNDFFKSRFFDDVQASNRRSSHGKAYEIFPAPASPGGFLAAWLVVLFATIGIASWSTIRPWLSQLLTRLFSFF